MYSHLDSSATSLQEICPNLHSVNFSQRAMTNCLFPSLSPPSACIFPYHVLSPSFPLHTLLRYSLYVCIEELVVPANIGRQLTTRNSKGDLRGLKGATRVM